MNKALDPEILVLGGGGLGTVTALEAAKYGYDVVLVRRSDRLSPQGDTFRNHGWLQSGLIYSAPRKLDLFESTLMYQWGIRLHRELLLEPPNQQGIFRTGSDEKAAQLVAASQRLQVPIDEAKDDEAKHFLRRFHKTRKHHFWVPDSAFHEAEVIMTAREMAREYGAELIDLPLDEDPPSFELDEKEPNGYTVRFLGRTIRPRVTIVCTGQALPLMLSQVNYFPPLAVFRSVLLRAENVDWIAAPLFYDLDAGFAIVNHASTIDPSKTWAVFGVDAKREKLTSTSRIVTPEEFDSAISFIPRPLRGSDPRKTFPATAGHKTEILDADGNPSAKHWIEEVPNCPGLYAAIPGKVTIVLWVALEILKKAGLIKATDEGDYVRVLPPSGSKLSGSSSSPSLPTWNGQVEMHWERPDLNDLQEDENKNTSEGEARGGAAKD